MGSITERIRQAKAEGHPAVQLKPQQLRELHRELLSTAGPLTKIQPAHLPPYSGPYLDLETEQVGEAKSQVTQGTHLGVYVLVAPA